MPPSCPSSSKATSCMLEPSSSTAFPGSPDRDASTAARSTGFRWRRTSSICTVVIPARCSWRKGCPASTARSWPVSPTSTSRAAPNRSAIRISEPIRSVDTNEASSSTTTEPPNICFSRSSAPSSPSAEPQRVRNHCRVRTFMPDSRSRTRAALASGASPNTGRSPASSQTWRSIVVLPVPAQPCTPRIRSRDSSTVRTASSWPAVRPAPARCAATSSAPASASPAPRPAFIAAITRRSAFSVRSVTYDRSEPRSCASTRWPSRTIHATASRISPSESRPGEWPSASASSSRSANTG